MRIFTITRPLKFLLLSSIIALSSISEAQSQINYCDGVTNAQYFYFELDASRVGVLQRTPFYNNLGIYQGSVNKLIIKDKFTNATLSEKVLVEDTSRTYTGTNVISMHRFDQDEGFVVMLEKFIRPNPLDTASYEHVAFTVQKFDSNFAKLGPEIDLDSTRKGSPFRIVYSNTFISNNRLYFNCPYMIMDPNLGPLYSSFPHAIILDSNLHTVFNDTLRRFDGSAIRDTEIYSPLDMKYSDEQVYVVGRSSKFYNPNRGTKQNIVSVNQSMNFLDSFSSYLSDVMFDSIQNYYSPQNSLVQELNRVTIGTGIGDSFLVHQNLVYFTDVASPFIITFKTNIYTHQVIHSIYPFEFGFKYISASYLASGYNPKDSLIYTVSFLTNDYGSAFFNARCNWQSTGSDSNLLLITAFDENLNLVGASTVTDEGCCHEDWGLFPSTQGGGAFVRGIKYFLDSFSNIKTKPFVFYFNGRSMPLSVADQTRRVIELSLYPNPAITRLTLKENEKLGQPQRIAIHSINGQLIREQEFDWSIDISDLQPGFYVYYMENKAGESFVQIFEKRE